MNGAALFGGTFDPIHRAHLEIARAAANQFELHHVLFIPAARPPHKESGAMAPFEDRVRMCELACESDPRFEVSRIEQGPDPSYSIVTAEKLLAEGRGPLSFLIGADAFAEIRSWFRWRDLIAAVEFLVVTRPGALYETPPGARVRELTGIAMTISSSGIRARLIAGEDCSADLPASVLNYIRANGLYR